MLDVILRDQVIKYQEFTKCHCENIKFLAKIWQNFTENSFGDEDTKILLIERILFVLVAKFIDNIKNLRPRMRTVFKFGAS